MRPCPTRREGEGRSERGCTDLACGRGEGKCKCMQAPSGVALVASQYDVTTVVIQTTIHATTLVRILTRNGSAPLDGDAIVR